MQLYIQLNCNRLDKHNDRRDFHEADFHNTLLEFHFPTV